MTTAPVDELLRHTFTTREVAEAALTQAKGNAVKARVALGKKKSTPVDPHVGEHVLALVVAAKAEGEPANAALGSLELLGYALPPDFAALLFAAAHWRLSDVDLGGASLFGPGVTTRDPVLRGDAATAFHFGAFASGERLVLRLGGAGQASYHAVPEDAHPTATSSSFASLNALLAHLLADARRRGLPGVIVPRPKVKPGKGPPRVAPAAEHRLFVGDQHVPATFPHITVEGTGLRVLAALEHKRTLPGTDLWFVHQDGRLFALRALGPQKAGRISFDALPA